MGMLSDLARKRLSAAGWTPGRDVREQVAVWKEVLSSQGGFEIFPAAERVLREFGGLDIQEKGPGVTCYRQPFTIDPTLGVKCKRLLIRYGDFLGAELYPIGAELGEDILLVIASDNRVFAIGEGVWLVGLGIVDALDALLVGRMPKFLGAPA